MGDVTLEIKLKNVKDKTDKIDVENAEINYVLTYDDETGLFTPKPPQGEEIIIDDKLSNESENPVQNKIITLALKVINDFISKFNFDNLETKNKWVLQYNANTDLIDLSESVNIAFNLGMPGKPNEKYRLLKSYTNPFNIELTKFMSNSNKENILVGYSNHSYISENSKSLKPLSEGLLSSEEQHNVNLPFGAGLYLLCCYEYNANSGAYRGTHMYTLCATDATTILQQTTVCASANSGVSITRNKYDPNSEAPSLIIKPNNSAYAVFYKIFTII